MSYIRKEELIRRMQDEPYELDAEAQYKSDMAIIESCSEVKAIPIPPKATNGDMIKTLFPNSRYEKVHSVMYSVHGQFDLDWWNAPYNPQQNLSYTDKSGANIASQDVLRSAT